MADPWSLAGDYFEACNCDVACPCVFLSDPTKGECTVLVAWHVRKGRSGNENLDGLNFALAAYAPGNMVKTKWEVAVYIDERANPRQRQILEAILGGQAGGPFAAFGPFFGKMHGYRFAPMEFVVDGKRRSLSIKGIAQMSSEAMAGAGGSEVKVSNSPLILVPEVTVAKATQLSLSDHGWKWESAGGNSFYSPFEFKGP